jgi:hypothetical protein
MGSEQRPIEGQRHVSERVYAPELSHQWRNKHMHGYDLRKMGAEF